jgi:hypothetical protein
VNAAKQKYRKSNGKGLLRRMYPGLSPEQAASMVRQRIMVEQLRKAAKSRKRRR